MGQSDRGPALGEFEHPQRPHRPRGRRRIGEGIGPRQRASGIDARRCCVARCGLEPREATARSCRRRVALGELARGQGSVDTGLPSAGTDLQQGQVVEQRSLGWHRRLCLRRSAATIRSESAARSVSSTTTSSPASSTNGHSTIGIAGMGSHTSGASANGSGRRPPALRSEAWAAAEAARARGVTAVSSLASAAARSAWSTAASSSPSWNIAQHRSAWTMQRAFSSRPPPPSAASRWVRAAVARIRGALHRAQPRQRVGPSGRLRRRIRRTAGMVEAGLDVAGVEPIFAGDEPSPGQPRVAGRRQPDRVGEELGRRVGGTPGASSRRRRPRSGGRRRRRAGPSRAPGAGHVPRGRRRRPRCPRGRGADARGTPPRRSPIGRAGG